MILAFAALDPAVEVMMSECLARLAKSASCRPGNTAAAAENTGRSIDRTRGTPILSPEGSNRRDDPNPHRDDFNWISSHPELAMRPASG